MSHHPYPHNPSVPHQASVTTANAYQPTFQPPRANTVPMSSVDSGQYDGSGGRIHAGPIHPVPPTSHVSTTSTCMHCIVPNFRGTKFSRIGTFKYYVEIIFANQGYRVYTGIWYPEKNLWSLIFTVAVDPRKPKKLGAI